MHKQNADIRPVQLYTCYCWYMFNGDDLYHVSPIPGQMEYAVPGTHKYYIDLDIWLALII